MEKSLAERVAVVEEKVSTLEDMAVKVNDIHEYVIADKANRRMRNRIFAGFAGFFGLAISAAELLKK
jgi:hypothetical protein